MIDKFISTINIGNNADILKDIIETSFDGIYITDAEANTVLINKSYETISGLKREELIGKNMRDLVAAGVFSISGTLLCLEHKKAITLEQVFKTNKKAVITSQPTFDSDGNIVMIVTNVRDMTEISKLQNKLKENELNNLKIKSILEQFYKRKCFSKNFVSIDEKSVSVLKLAKRVAATDVIVTILGETGVGKELMAEYIYKNSKRSSEVFLKLNCAELNPSLIESELFGYEKGTFTGGNKNGKLGFFEMANGGTLFLDEIGELELNMQVKLLRVLQEQEIRRLGSTSPVKINVRIIVATNKNLAELVEQGKFRKDLYYRLEAFQIIVPPLRDRKKDIVPLAELFLKKLNDKYQTQKYFSEESLNVLKSYNYPGNIRELKNIIERSYIVSDNLLEFDNLNSKQEKNLDFSINLKEKLEEIECQYIKSAFEKYQNIRKAAESLQMDSTTYFRKKQKYNI